MILTNDLKGIIAKQGYSQRRLALELGMSEKTFYSKMKKGVFDSNEMEAMIKILKIENPADIFFAQIVA